jgi:hypothetical protein
MSQRMVDLIVKAKELGATLEQVLWACRTNSVCTDIALDVYGVVPI